VSLVSLKRVPKCQAAHCQEALEEDSYYCAFLLHILGVEIVSSSFEYNSDPVFRHLRPPPPDPTPGPNHGGGGVTEVEYKRKVEVWAEVGRNGSRPARPKFSPTFFFPMTAP
jgi:hypothetical protein